MHPFSNWEKSLEYANIDVWDEEVSMSKENEIHEAWKLEEHFRHNKEIPISFIRKYYPDFAWLLQASSIAEAADIITHHYDANGTFTGKSYAKNRYNCCRCC